MKYYIYSISHKVNPELGTYIGSTRDIPRRLATHKYECKNNNTNHLYKVIRENGGFNAWIMKQVEIICSDDPEDRRKAEQKHIDNLDIKLNTNQAYCPYKIYYNRHRDDILEYKKTYYINNKQAIQKRKQLYQRRKRLEHIAALQQQGLQPKRSSKNDPNRISPPDQPEKMIDNNIENDCECGEVQCQE